MALLSWRHWVCLVDSLGPIRELTDYWIGESLIERLSLFGKSLQSDFSLKGFVSCLVPFRGVARGACDTSTFVG